MLVAPDKVDAVDTCATEPRPPVSVSQEAILYQSLLAPQARSYNETISIRKDGPLDPGALRRALNEIVRRHAAWRTTFDMAGGKAVQVVHEATTFELPLVDLSGLGDMAERRAVEMVAEVSKVPYDLRRGPLIRPRLVKLADDHHRLYLAMHHLIFDGVSLYRVVLPELAALYQAFSDGTVSPLPGPKSTYAEYAAWEQEWMLGPRAKRDVEYWRGHLEGVPFLSLPVDQRRLPSPEFAGAVKSLVVRAGTVRRLRALAQDKAASLFQVLAAAWSIVLAIASGERDVTFATAADLRQRPEFEQVVGCSLTPLVLRLDLSSDPAFSDVVVAARNEVLDGLQHLVPFERLVRELKPATPAGANPIYQTMLVLEPPVAEADPAWSVHQMEAAIGNAVGGSKLDLELGLDERPNGDLDGRLVYDRNLFSSDTADRFIRRFIDLLEQVAESPAARLTQLARIGLVEARQLESWNATKSSLGGESPGSLADLIWHRAKEHPDRVALSTCGRDLTYGALCGSADAIAQRLRREGIRADDLAPLGGPVTADLVTSVLGRLRAGASYRIADGGPVEAELRPDAVINVVVSLASDLGLGPADTILAFPETLPRSLVVDLFMPLSAGARVLCAPGGLAGNGIEVSRIIARDGVSFLRASAQAWRHLVESGLRPSRNLTALCDGGAPDEELADAILDRVRVLFTAFGTNETVPYAIWGRVERMRPVTIGRPGANVRAYVVGDDGRPVGADVVGRLMVAGECVLPGVDDKGAKTVRTPRLGPFEQGPLVFTGARARWRAGGDLELV